MKRKQWSQRLRHVVLMCAAAIGLTAFGDEVSVAKPVVEYGADYTRATVTAAVEGTTSGDVTYELTVTKGATTATYTGTVSDGKVTFADVEVPRDAANIYADITYTVTPKAGTAALTSAATTEAPTTKSEWAFSSTVSGGEVDNNGGSWTAGAPTVAAGRLSVNDATFTAKPKSADDIVVITMEGVIFGDINDAEIADAQAGIRIGESGEFEVLSATGWIETEIPANGEQAYDVVLTINYATKTYSVKIGTGTFDNISLAGSETGVNAIEFNGSGSLASLAGEAYDGNMVVDKNGKKYATVDAAIAALKAGTATAPLTMLHNGTAPAGWTIKDGKLDTAQAEVVIDETPTGTNPVTVSVAVPQDCTAAGLIDKENRAEGDILKVWSTTDKCYYTWELTAAKEWEPKETYKVTETEEATTHLKAASEVNLKAGQAVWVTIKTSASVKLLVTYNAVPVKVAVESGWNLVAPTTPGDTTVKAIIESTGAAANDSIVVPTKTVPKVYTKVNGEWGYTTIVEVENKNGLKIGRSVHNVEDTTIKAGTGVWFVNGSSDSKDISL